MSNTFQYKQLFPPEAIEHLEHVYEGLEPFFLDEVMLETRATEFLVVYEKYLQRYKAENDLDIYFETLNAIVNDGVYWKQMLPKTEKLVAFKDLFQRLCSFYPKGSQEKTKCDSALAVLTKAYSLIRSDGA